MITSVSVMESVCFEDLRTAFQVKLSGASSLLKQRDFTEEDACVDEMQLVDSELRELCTLLAMFKMDIEKKTQEYEQLKKTIGEVRNLKEQLKYTTDNLPQRFPKPSQSCKEETNKENTTVPCKAAKEVANQNAANIPLANQNKAPPTSAPIGKPQENMYFPELDYLTVDEFDTIPKYLKGRLTYDKLNKFIDAMNITYKAKYKILKQSLRSLNDANRKRCDAYKSHETKDTKGCYFIVDEDIKDHGSRRVDKEAGSILAILRHCGRIREVRGGRLARYVYIDRY